MRNIVLRFDLRTAPFSPEPYPQRYRACCEMACWADSRKIDLVAFSEHHNVSDGFLSAPLMLAMAAAVQTQRVRLAVSALLLPLYDPLRLAEDITALDLAADGRFVATAGLGYRPEEYRALGVDWSRRGEIFDEKLSLVLSALAGETVTFNGEAVKLSPQPQSPANMLLTIGGNSAAAARRAARFKLFFCPAIDDHSLGQAYQRECERLGFTDGYTIYPQQPATTLLAQDIEQAWQEIGPYLLYDARAYGAWRHKNRRAYAESQATDLEQLRAEGKYRILTPAQAVTEITDRGALHLAPLCGGTPLAAAWRTLELFETQVQPYID